MEPQFEKMYILSRAPDKDSNELAHSRCPHENTLHSWLSKMRPVKILNAQSDLNLPWADIYKGTCLALRINISFTGLFFITIAMYKLQYVEKQNCIFFYIQIKNEFINRTSL